MVSDSIEIARYLDATYPDLPRLIPAGTAAFHYAFTEAHEATLGTFNSYTLPATLPVLNVASQAYFRRTREAMFGKCLEDVTPTGAEMWEQVKDGFGQIDGWINKNGAILMSVADTDTDTEYYVIFFTCHRHDRDAQQTLNNKSRILLPTLCDIKLGGIPAL